MKCVRKISFAFIWFSIASILLLCGCSKHPVKQNYIYDSCYLAADCLYYNIKNPDKTVCVEYIKACNDDIILKRKMNIIEYCASDKRPLSMTEKECLFYLGK